MAKRNGKKNESKKSENSALGFTSTTPTSDADRLARFKKYREQLKGPRAAAPVVSLRAEDGGVRETVIAPQQPAAGATESAAPAGGPATPPASPLVEAPAMELASTATPAPAAAKAKKARTPKPKKEKVSTAGKVLPCTGSPRCRCHPSRKYCANKPPAVETPKVEAKP